MLHLIQRALLAVSLLFFTVGAQNSFAADYKVDLSHSFVQFRTQHLGISWLIGRFNQFDGTFKYDAANNDGPTEVVIDLETASVDTNHAERDKHLRSDDFLHVKKYPSATFLSEGYSGDANGGELRGTLSLHGETKPLTIQMEKIGEGDDPWGGYRVGFEGSATITRADFGMTRNLGPGARDVELEFYIEGIRQ